MFEKIKQKVQQALKNVKNSNTLSEQKTTGHFNDEIARKTQWSPIKSGGSNFKTHDLVKKSMSVLTYKMSTGAKLFSGFFGFIGVSMAVGGLYLVFFQSNYVGLFLIMIGLMFAIVSFVIVISMASEIHLDRTIGMMYKGNNPPKLSGLHDKTDCVYFSNIHAIQIIKEYIRSDKSCYYSYEINFVLNDASRVNLVDHGNYSQIAKDAKEISQFIGKPVWDAVKLG